MHHIGVKSAAAPEKPPAMYRLGLFLNLLLG